MSVETSDDDLVGRDRVAHGHAPLDHDALGDRLHVGKDDRHERAVPPRRPRAPAGGASGGRGGGGGLGRRRRAAAAAAAAPLPAAVAAAVAGAQLGQQRAHLDGLTGGGHDARHRAGGGRRHLDVHLVGGHVEEGVTRLDASPSETLHSTTTPSVTDSPSSGSRTWIVWEEVVDTRRS